MNVVNVLYVALSLTQFYTVLGDQINTCTRKNLNTYMASRTVVFTANIKNRPKISTCRIIFKLFKLLTYPVRSTLWQEVCFVAGSSKSVVLHIVLHHFKTQSLRTES